MPRLRIGARAGKLVGPPSTLRLPVVFIHIWEGRTVDQKRRLAKAVTDAMVEHADATPDGLHVAIEDWPRQNWARAGVLGIDRTNVVEPEDRPPQVFGPAHAMLQVRDLDEAEAFYVGLLGFTIRKHGETLDGRPLIVTHQGLGLAPGRPAVDESVVEHMAFRVRHVRKIEERLREGGAVIDSGPLDTEYGLSLYVRDPDGNKIELIGAGERPSDVA